jgi:phage gp29-like protein
VTDLAELLGWTWAHFRPAMTARGWRTAVEGPGGVGFPDLILWRDRTIFVELKANGGRLRPEQQHTVECLQAAGAEVHVFRPRDWDQVRRTLEGRTA